MDTRPVAAPQAAPQSAAPGTGLGPVMGPPAPPSAAQPPALQPIPSSQRANAPIGSVIINQNGARMKKIGPTQYQPL